MYFPYDLKNVSFLAYCWKLPRVYVSCCTDSCLIITGKYQV